MARIPMSADVAELIGTAAEKVENRSLLLEKFSFHKLWPVAEGDHGRVKWDEATRWDEATLRDIDSAAGLFHGRGSFSRRTASRADSREHAASRA